MAPPPPPLTLGEENHLLKQILIRPPPVVRLRRIPDDGERLAGNNNEIFDHDVVNVSVDSDEETDAGEVVVTLQTGRDERACRSRKSLRPSPDSNGFPESDVEAKRPKGSHNSVDANGEDPICKLCGQLHSRAAVLPDTEQLSHLNDDGNEPEALFALMSSEGLDTLDTHEKDGFMIQLENFAIYDAKGHLVPIDSLCDGVKKKLYFLGRIKAYSRWEGEGVLVRDVGPIQSWWLERKLGADSTILGISTEAAHYYFGSARPEYAPLLEPLEVKCNLVYDLIDVLQINPDASLVQAIESLEENYLEAEELLYKHAEFIVDQIATVDEENEDDFSSTPAVEALEVYLNGQIKGRKWTQTRGRTNRVSQNSLATTTPLVLSAFENLFPKQIKGASAKDCDEAASVETRAIPWPPKIQALDRTVEWDGQPVKNLQGRRHYSRCTIKHSNASFGVKVGDFVTVLVSKVRRDCPPFAVLKVHEIFEDSGEKLFHGIRFLQGVETILGEALNPMELFVSRDCGDFSLCDVDARVQVKPEKTPSDWQLAGGRAFKKQITNEYTYRLRVEVGECRFEAVDSFNCDLVPPGKLPECENCEWNESTRSSIVIHAKLDDETIQEVRCHGVTYAVGDFVMIDPKSMEDCWIKHGEKPPNVYDLAEKDSEVYPELPRKLANLKPKGYLEGLVAPLRIGRIEKFLARETAHEGSRCPNLTAEVRVMRRVDEVDRKARPVFAKLHPHGLLYSDEVQKRKVADFVGKCKVTRQEFLPDDSGTTWRAQQGFVLMNDAPKHIHEQCVQFAKEVLPAVKPLKCMDLFAGVGGLSIGLDHAGVSKTMWAVEFNHAAAQSFKLNHPSATVYEGDINKILRVMLEAQKNPNKDMRWKGVELPRPGEVDMITGGPPCQGFSQMNMYNYRENAQFRNSLVATYLSCVEYYRPRFVIMENVKSFVNYNKGVVLKFLLKSLVEMGYQCCAGVLQAGHFGVPQSRLRAFIIAAAPGETLPRYPRFLTTFSDKLTTFNIDGIVYSAENTWGSSSSAPFRAVTIGDAISDLPPVVSGEWKESQRYKCDPQSAFQVEVREHSSEVRDHISKSLAPIQQFRVEQIPRYPGADWRDLPNIEVEVDGVLYNKIPYRRYGKVMGVCKCAPVAGEKGFRCPKEVSEHYKQHRTVIPWYLAHSAASYAQKTGAFGRLLKDGYFPTTLTTIDPNGKAGNCLHYDQDRTFTVREWARSQGFPDSVHFYGRLEDRYRQIGNAVPPPLARAIGFQIRVALLGGEKN